MEVGLAGRSGTQDLALSGLDWPDMRFEKAIDISAPQQRVWDVLSDLEAWPRRIDTVDVVELLTPAPLYQGQPRPAQATEAARGRLGRHRLGRTLLLRVDPEDRRHHKRR